MNKIKLAFWDFDGTMCLSPTPSEGKDIWQKVTGNPWPYEGWWGRLETLDDSVFDIQLNEDILQMYRSMGNHYIHYIHTSRLSKFKPYIENILRKFNVKMYDILTKVHNLDKGERIIEILERDYLSKNIEVSEIFFADDRMKEITAVENIRPILDKYGIKLTIVKTESDADD